MKPYLFGCAAFVLLGGAAASLAQPAARPQPIRIDFGQAETPRKALPKWMKLDKEGKQVVVDQGDHDPRLKGYFTPEGVKVEIVADAPVIANPHALAFTDDGQPLVLETLPGTLQDAAETVTYKDGSKRTFATPKKSTKDVVKLLRDTKGAGVYDEAKVILEDDLPGALLVHDGWLYTSGRGTVQRWKLADLIDRPADKAQPKGEVIAKGFGGSGPTGLTIGNDGLLYITAGDDDHFAEGADGSRATVLRTGAIFRCKPDGAKLQTVATGFRNLRGNLAFDINFNAFHVDGEGEPTGRFAGCRLIHVLEDADYGWRSLAGTRPLRPDLVRAADHGELPGQMPPMVKTGAGAPNGLFIYNESRFPNYYRNVLYYPDPLRQVVRAYRVLPHGSTFEVGAEFDFLRSADPLFRPTQMTAGPDGAMYLVDSRSDPAKGADGKHGRLYRITWSGNADFPAVARREMTSWAGFGKAAAEDLLKGLGSNDASDRLRAQQALAKKGGAEIRADLLDVTADSKASLGARLAAMGALQAMWNDEVRDEFLALVYAGDPAIRRLAADGLALNCKAGDIEADQTLLQVMGDQDLGARRAIMLAAGRIGGVNAADSLANTFRSNKEDDLFLGDGILRGIERLGKPGIVQLVAQAQSGVDKDFDRVVEAFRTLRVRPAADAIPELLSYPHLNIPQRVNLIKSYSNYLLEPPVALAPLLRYLDANKTEPPQVKLAALEVLATPGQAHTDKAEALALPLLDQTEAAFRMAVIRAIETGKLAKTVHKLTGLLTEKDRPVEEQQAIVVVLGQFKDKWPVALLKELVADGMKPGPVRAEGVRVLAELDPAAGREAAKALAADKDADVQKAARRVLEK